MIFVEPLILLSLLKPLRAGLTEIDVILYAWHLPEPVATERTLQITFQPTRTNIPVNLHPAFTSEETSHILQWQEERRSERVPMLFILHPTALKITREHMQMQLTHRRQAVKSKDKLLVVQSLLFKP